MYFNTPLRYPGGKGKLTDYIKLLFVQNDLIGGEYCEPYAGGAGIAINLLLDGYASTIHLNDLNRGVYSFWRSILSQPDEFCARIERVPVDMDEWHRQREVAFDDASSEFDMGFATFFLNRCNRSGIIKGGVVGGKDQAGPWKLDARFKKQELISRIERIALKSDQIHVYNRDAAALITDVLPNLSENTLVYLDPPYYVKGSGLYQNFYKHEDHERIAELVKTKISLPWLVSYDHAPEIVSMYAGCRTITYGINYSAQNRYKGAEVMFFSPKLEIPDVANPAKVTAA
jgi:Site-specific DNA methylase